MDFFEPDEKRRKAAAAELDASERIYRSRLGRSILGKDIDIYRIGHGKRGVLMVGAHHGTEHITGAILFSLLSKIAAASDALYSTDLDLYFAAYTLWVVPVLNCDGVELAINGAYENPLSARQMSMSCGAGFSDWQANARGVDLNHNYSYGFAEYKEIEKEKKIFAGRSLYSGEYPESEPESRSLAKLVRSIDLSLVVSLHSQGEEIYAFPSGSPYSARIAGRLGERLGYEIAVPGGTAAYGGFCDYTGNELGIPSLTLEVGRGSNPLPRAEYNKIRARLVKELFLLPLTL